MPENHVLYIAVQRSLCSLKICVKHLSNCNMQVQMVLVVGSCSPMLAMACCSASLSAASFLPPISPLPPPPPSPSPPPPLPPPPPPTLTPVLRPELDFLGLLLPLLVTGDPPDTLLLEPYQYRQIESCVILNSLSLEEVNWHTEI